MSYSPSELLQILQQNKFKDVETKLMDFIEMNAKKEHFMKIDNPLTEKAFNDVSVQQKCVDAIGAYANVFVNLFCHPQYVASAEFLNKLIVHKQVLEMIFSLSPWKTTDPIIEKLGLTDVLTAHKQHLNRKAKARISGLLSLYCLESKYSLPWKYLFEKMPDLALISYFGLLNQSISVLSNKRRDAHEQLLHQAAEFPMQIIKNQSVFSLVSVAYFYCSYTTSPHKYEVKKWISKLLHHNRKHWLSEDVYQYVENVRNHEISSSPTIVVALEHYTKGHAMYRYYNATLRDLSKYYKLVGVVDIAKVNEMDLSIFTELVLIPEDADLDDTSKKIIAHTPDIVLYPSIGMQTWAIRLASLRLAPIQAMMGGHPSSSYSHAIDYYILPFNHFSRDELQAFMHEEIIIDDNASKHNITATALPELSSDFIEQHQQFLPNINEDSFVIGINGVITKVSMDVIDYCKKINDGAEKSVKFVFFSNHPKNHLSYITTKLQLQEQLPNFELIGYSDYLTYMKVISTCHLLLPTLPFGGSNSNIDAMILNKPKFFIDGKLELYTRTDKLDWMRVGLDKTFECASVDQLVQRSLELIGNEDKRLALHKIIEQQCDSSTIFHEDCESGGSSIVDQLQTVIQHHVRVCEPTENA